MSRKLGRTMLFLGILVLVLILPLAARAEEATGGSRVRVRDQQVGLLARYREKFQLLKDSRKKALVDKLNNRICTLNQNRVVIMNQHLDRMLVVINRVEEKAGEMKKEGRDVSRVETAVDKARKAVAGARTAVKAQGEKECVIEISGSDATVGAEVRRAISGLEADIKAVRAELTTARKAVSEAIRTLAGIWGVKVNVNLEEGE